MNNYRLNDWTLEYTHFDPDSEKHTEALTTLANGYMGTRGAHEDCINDEHHYPATYIAGLYNRLFTRIAGKKVDNEDLVRCPDWTHIRFRIGSEPWFSLNQVKILKYLKQLDLQKGLWIRKITVSDKKGRITKISSERLVSMAHPNICAMEYRITPENYSATIKIKSGINGAVRNQGVERYKQLNSLHLKPESASFRGECIEFAMRTTESNVTVAMVARHTPLFTIAPAYVNDIKSGNGKYLGKEFQFRVQKGDSIGLSKIVAVKTSQVLDVKNPLVSARNVLEKVKSYKTVKSRHQLAWQNIWNKINIEIEGDKEQERLLRFHLYHLACCATTHNTKIDASIPARGLHGEAYRGHIFWDDLFLFPFFCHHQPKVAKSLLMYRVRRLNKAREYAIENGYRGAMYPWQSGKDGREETQKLHLNPVSGEWGIDLSRRQRHVSLAIFYDIWEYVHVTGDKRFLNEHVAEVLFEIGRFWSSIAKYNNETKKFDISGVMGPDEFHEKLPKAKEPGVTNNAYTNLLTSWALQKCLEVCEQLPVSRKNQLMAKLKINNSEIDLWRKISEGLDLEIQKGIISHFNGFLALKELDWNAYRKKYKSIGRMDRILKSEGLSPDDYRLSKQADFLMLFYLFTFEEAKDIFNRLGINFDKNQLKKNYQFYLKRTSHGSTLSYVVHTHLAVLLGKTREGYNWFKQTLKADISDIQGGTTQEGIHTGLMGGTIQLFIRSFAGIGTSKDILEINPKLPAKWKKVRFNLLFRKIHYYLEISAQNLRIKASKSGSYIKVGNKKVKVTDSFKKVKIE